MGASVGWVSVDPTPSPANGEQTGSGVLVNHTLGGGGSKGHGTTSTTRPNKVKSKLPLPANPSPTSANAAHKARRSAPLPAGLILAGVVLVLVVAGGLFAYRRSRRSVRYGGYFARGSSDPDHVVLHAWSRASTALGRAGYRRPLWETPSAHAAEVRAAVVDGVAGAKRPESTAALGTATYGYTELAQLAELACYCPGRCTSRDARHAEQEAWRIERALRSSGMFRRFPGPPVAPGTVLTGSLAGSASRGGGPGAAAILGSSAPTTPQNPSVERRSQSPAQALSTGSVTSSVTGSEPGDELLHAVVVRSEGILQQHRALRLIVQLQVHPVHCEIAPALLCSSYELPAKARPRGGGRLVHRRR